MRLVIGCAITALACSHSQPALLPPPDPALVRVDNAELIGQLRRMISEVITTEAQDREHVKVAAEVSRRRLFVGRSEREIMETLGEAHFNACTAEGYCLGEGAVRALRIDIGHLPPTSIGGTPVLVIRLDRQDICTGTHLFHEQ